MTTTIDEVREGLRDVNRRLGELVHPTSANTGSTLSDVDPAAMVQVDALPPAPALPPPALHIVPALANPAPSAFTPWKPDPTRKLIILGFASSSRDLAPIGDESFEVWSLNHAYSFCSRWTRWFDMHPPEAFQKQADHFEWLKGRTAPRPDGTGSVYMQDHYGDIPASVKFPRAEINEWLAGFGDKKVGYYADDYYTSSISQMLALGMMEGFGEIQIYGVDLLQDEEYYYQRAGAEYLIGLARGLGFKVYLPPQCALCKANYTYGYSELASDGAKGLTETADYFEAQGAKAMDIMHQAAGQANVMDGAIQMAGVIKAWILEVASKDSPERAEILKRIEMKTADLQKRFAISRDSANINKGQCEAFKTGAIWLKHVARGGKLTA